MFLPVDINLSRPVHFAELESGVFTVFHALISSQDQQEGGSLRGVPFRDDANYRLPKLELWKGKEKKDYNDELFLRSVLNNRLFR